MTSGDRPDPAASSTSPISMPDADRPRQAALDLRVDQTSWAREDFCVSPANEAALQLVDQWPDWPMPWIALYGPRGCGKRHLARIWAQRSRAVTVALDTITVESVPDLAAAPALVVEAGAAHVQGGVDWDETALFHLINYVREEGRTGLITAQADPGAWPVANEHLASRLKAVLGVAIAEPDDALLEGVLAKLFRDRQVTVAPDVIRYLVTRMERSLEAAVRLADSLDTLSLEHKHAITKPMAARVLEQEQETGRDIAEP